MKFLTQLLCSLKGHAGISLKTINYGVCKKCGKRIYF